MAGFLLKLFSAIAAMGFGAMGIGRETRNKETGKLTRSGKIALWGIIVAFIVGAASTVYDYVSAERTAAANQKAAQTLIYSVKQGLYPFRNITADLTLSLGNTFPGVKELPKLLPSAGTVYFNGGKVPGYPSGLPTSSTVYKALRGQSVDVFLFRRVAEAPYYRPLGTFIVSNGRKLNERTALTFDPEKQTVEAYQSFALSNEYVQNAHVQSLVDFTPGAIFTTPAIEPEDILTFCEEAGARDLPDCRKRYVDLMAAAVGIEYLTLRFEHVKQVSINPRTDKICDALGRKWLTTIRTWDIAEMEQPAVDIAEQRKLACDAFNNGGKRR
jgi:hypothetical protein